MKAAECMCGNIRIRRKYLFVIVIAIIVSISSVLFITHDNGDATHLVIFFPPNVHPGIPAKLTVAALNDHNQKDASRDDLIEVSLNPEAHAKVGIEDIPQSEWSHKITVNLIDGEANFFIIIEKREVIFVSAKWIEGRSFLISRTIAWGDVS